MRDTAVQPKGHGYKVTLPGTRAAGFRDGDIAPVRHALGLLIITTEDQRYVRRGEDLEANWREIQR